MSEVEISVRGEHEERVPAEEATAQITVRADGPDRGAVVEQLAAAAGPVRDDLRARQDAGALVSWTSSRANVWTERPWSPDGARLDPVHHASVELAATYTDPAALSAWLDEVALRDGVQVDAVVWRLTEATESTARARVAAIAVQRAVERATAYATAIGRESVVPIAIADTGLLSPDTPPSAPRMMRAMATSADAGGPAIELRPEDIVVTASVDARFLAR